jgi:hypothetical protein
MVRKTEEMAREPVARGSGASSRDRSALEGAAEVETEGGMAAVRKEKVRHRVPQASLALAATFSASSFPMQAGPH